jgi:hypothetical protein
MKKILVTVSALIWLLNSWAFAQESTAGEIGVSGYHVVAPNLEIEGLGVIHIEYDPVSRYLLVKNSDRTPLVQGVLTDTFDRSWENGEGETIYIQVVASDTPEGTRYVFTIIKTGSNGQINVHQTIEVSVPTPVTPAPTPAERPSGSRSAASADPRLPDPSRIPDPPRCGGEELCFPSR